MPSLRHSNWVPDLSEHNIQDDVIGYARSKRWLHRKLKWVGRRSAPDDLFAKDGRVMLVEFKKTGKPLRIDQKREHKRLVAAGIEVHVIDNAEDGYALFD